MNKGKLNTMSMIAAGMALSGGIGLPEPRREQEPHTFTEFDQIRLDRAEAKRDRKAKILADRGHL